MILTWHRDDNILIVGNRTFTVTNRVRNEIDPDAVRKLHDPSEVRKSVINGQWGPAYMPRKFPLGTWNILEIEETSVPDFAPIKIKTDAHQKVHAWALDANGGYDHELPDLIDDSGYHLHWCQGSRATLGCGRVGTDSDEQVRELAQIIKGAWLLKDTVQLQVL
jgi:hypothetical protein